MKKLMCVCLVMILVLMAAMASAEEKNSLSDFSNRLKKASVQETASAEDNAEDDGVSYGPALKIDDPFFKKIRSSAYLHETEYSKEANVMIKLENVSGRTLYPNGASVTAYSKTGEVIEEETYSGYGPEMVENGENLYIWDWFYGFETPVSEIGYFEVKIETETSSYHEYAKIDGMAMVSDGIAYALVENTTENDIYGVSATICIENAEGTLLDVCEISTSNASGIFPGSVMILRENAKDYATDSILMEGVASVSVLHQLD